MRHRQSVRFPSWGRLHLWRWGLLCAAAWALTLWGAKAVYLESWVRARQGSQLIYDFGYMGGIGEAALTALGSCASALFWLVGAAVLRPASRRERWLLRVWWPALVLGFALPFVVRPVSVAADRHAQFVFAAVSAPTVAQVRFAETPPATLDLEDLTARVHRALPWAPGGAEFGYQRAFVRLRYADQLSFEMTPEGRVRRVLRAGKIDDAATLRHRGHTERQVIAQLGEPQSRQPYFKGHWRLAYGNGYSWLAYSDATGAWCRGRNYGAEDRSPFGEPDWQDWRDD